MRRPVRALSLVVGASLLCLGGLGAQTPGVGDAAPVLAVHDLNGTPVDLGQWIGKTPVFLEFWATWCTSCAALEPAVRAARNTYGSRVEFLGVNITVGDPRAEVRAWVAEKDPPWRTLYDDEGVSQRAYDVAATSYVVIIDRAGRIVYTGIGGSQSFGAALRRATAQ